MTNKTKTDNSASRMMLDAYFKFRSPLPDRDENGRYYKKCFKTTEEIAADLITMVAIEYCDIVTYMQQHEYVVATQPDGTIAWAIWEKMIDI